MPLISVAPPPFSMTTATATLGCAAGANDTNHACGRRSPSCAVPVLPATWMPLIWPLVPVPLYWTRRQHRHFNQAAEIARLLGRRFGLPVCPALRRVRRTETQTHLTRHQRLANLKGAFEVARAGRALVDQGIGGVVLVDDVFTTGATVHECARTLKKAGFQKVVVVTVMRG